MKGEFEADADSGSGPPGEPKTVQWKGTASRRLLIGQEVFKVGFDLGVCEFGGNWTYGQHGRGSLRFEVLFHVEVATHVAEGFFAEGELLQVVSPDVLAAAAAGEGLTGDGADGAIGFAALEGVGGELKGDDFAGLPEGAGEFVREEEDVVAASFGESGESSGCVCPLLTEPRDVPSSEVEAIGSGLSDQDLQQFKPCHIEERPREERFGVGCSPWGYSLRWMLLI